MSEMGHEIRARILASRKRACADCGDTEWMYLGEQEGICWRCRRIREGLGVAKPDGEQGWLFWSFVQKAWIAHPSMPEGEEWGNQG